METINRVWCTLEGKFFHKFDENSFVVGQGFIVARIAKTDRYAVQYMDWLTGKITLGIDVVDEEEFSCYHWKFYETIEEMIDAFEHAGYTKMVEADI